MHEPPKPVQTLPEPPPVPDEFDNDQLMIEKLPTVNINEDGLAQKCTRDEKNKYNNGRKYLSRLTDPDIPDEWKEVIVNYISAIFILSTRDNVKK